MRVPADFVDVEQESEDESDFSDDYYNSSDQLDVDESSEEFAGVDDDLSSHEDDLDDSDAPVGGERGEEQGNHLNNLRNGLAPLQ